MTFRSRCGVHGLLLGSDGRCTRCAKESDRRDSRRLLTKGIALFAGLFLVLLGLRMVILERSTAEPHAVSAARGNARLVLYTTESCPWCRKAKRWLDDRKIPYTVRDIGEDEAARDELKRLTLLRDVVLRARVRVRADA
jgi:hypothetical protein